MTAVHETKPEYDEMGKHGPRPLVPGDEAPDFALLDQHGESHRLSDYRGRWLVLYFYPRDETPGCTAEACAFRDDLPALRRLDAAVVGISLDQPRSHGKFARKHGLPFPLLSDPDGVIARRYGALLSLGFVRFAKRHSFLIDPEGRIAGIYRRLKPAAHSARIIEALRELTASR